MHNHPISSAHPKRQNKTASNHEFNHECDIKAAEEEEIQQCNLTIRYHLTFAQVHDKSHDGLSLDVMA